MHISCEKCATTYNLDDRLIPAAGAPVQCTKCGHVFLAKPPEVAAEPAPRSASQTMVFGAKAGGEVGGAPSASPPRPSNQRLVFGAPGGAVPSPPLGARPNATMVFGAASAGAVPSAPAAKPNATMVFGAANAGAVPSAPAAKPNATMVFGAANAGAVPSAPAAKPNATMVFGAANAGVVPSAPAAKPNATMVFGAANAGAVPSAPAAGRGANQTIAFGTPAVAPPATRSANSTMVFGAQPAGARGAGSTLAFGAAATEGPVPSPSPSAPKPNATMVFGALSPAAAKGAATPGAGAEEGEATAAQSGRTMLFARPPEQPEAEEPTAAQSGSTRLFGAPGAGSAPTSAPNTTVIFGAAEARAQPSKLTESTVRIGMDDLQRMMKDHRARRGEETTPAQSDSEAEPAPRDNKTQLFALSDVVDPATGASAAAVVTPSEGREAVEARHDRTQLFAMKEPDPASTLPPDEPPPAPAPRPRAARDPSLFETLPPNAAPARLDLGQRLDMQLATPPLPVSFQSTLQEEEPLAPQPLARMTAPDLDPVARPRPDAPVELPPESDLLPSTGPGGGADAQGEEAYAQLAEQQSRRGRLVLVLLLIALVIAIGAVAWKLVGPRLLSNQAPTEAIEGTAQAMATLRKDDTADKRAAIDDLQRLIVAYPEFVEAHAGLVTAIALQLDDVNQRANRLAESIPGAKGEPADAERAAAAKKLREQHAGMVALSAELNAQLKAAWEAMGKAQQRALSRQETLAVLRAQALGYAVNGEKDAMALDSRSRTAAGDAESDGWVSLAIPEYVVNTPAPSDALVKEAFDNLQALEKHDSTFLRVAVLKARLLARQKDYKAAEEELERVLALTKSGHDIAVEMLAWVKEKHRQADDNNPATPPP